MSESELKPPVSKAHSKTSPTIPLFGHEFHMPRSRWLRVAIGVGLVFLGCLGFLPVLGFWMIPLGLLVLSYEFHVVRRQRRRFIVWREKRRKRKV